MAFPNQESISIKLLFMEKVKIKKKGKLQQNVPFKDIRKELDIRVQSQI